MKTNGARFLESLNIPFELREYEVDPEDLSATTVAKKIGMPAEQVFKTLLTMGGPGSYCFAVIPGNEELDPSTAEVTDPVVEHDAILGADAGRQRLRGGHPSAPSDGGRHPDNRETAGQLTTPARRRRFATLRRSVEAGRFCEASRTRPVFTLLPARER